MIGRWKVAGEDRAPPVVAPADEALPGARAARDRARTEASTSAAPRRTIGNSPAGTGSPASPRAVGAPPPLLRRRFCRGQAGKPGGLTAPCGAVSPPARRPAWR